MKNTNQTFKLFLAATLLVFLTFNCSKKTPKACVTMTQDGNDVANGTAKVNKEVIFTSCGEGDKFSVWAGDTLHMYGTTGTGFDLTTGLSANKTTYKYAYPKTGKYTITAVATYVTDGEVDLATKTYSIEIVNP